MASLQNMTAFVHMQISACARPKPAKEKSQGPAVCFFFVLAFDRLNHPNEN